MAKIIELPKLSPTMEEGTLVRWARNEGDAIAVDDLLAEVETDKATMEFRSFDKGTLLKKLVAEGATAKLGQPVAIFGTPGEDISSLLAQVGSGAGAAPAPSPAAAPSAAPAAPASSPASSPSPSPAQPSAPSTAAPPAAAAPAAAATPPPPRRPSGPAPSWVSSQPGLAGVILLPSAPSAAAPAGEAGGPSSPRVRREARERGIDLALVRGTGPNGRITLADLERPAAAAARPAAAPGAPTAPGAARPESTSRPASQMRKAIARRLTESKRDVPHFYLEADLDVAALLALREQLNDGLEKDQRVSVNDLFVRACAVALREVPAANSSWVDGTIVQHHRADISVAVAIEDGLVTPVVRDADVKSIRAISVEVRDLAARARSKKLKPEEMTGGTMSLSNLGMYGIDRFAAVINPPEGMILAVGATREVPVVRDGQIVPGQRCAVTLSCDHRVVDGALGAQYLKALRGLVERPVKILA